MYLNVFPYLWDFPFAIFADFVTVTVTGFVTKVTGMGRRREESDPDRFLLIRGGNFYYSRQVPKVAVDLDSRSPVIRLSLRTSDISKARALRDIYERADNELWAAYLIGNPEEAALQRHKAMVARAAALGFTYRPASEIALQEPVAAIRDRIASVPKDNNRRDVDAILGLSEGADKKIKAALQTYFESVVPDKLRVKSADQKKRWKAKREAAVETFIDICGNVRMTEITRADAQNFHAFWMKRVAPQNGKPSHSASFANQNMAHLRTLYSGWFTYMGDKGRSNPFDGLGFSDKTKRSRPPFSVNWIKANFLSAGKLDDLNLEARAIFLTLIETGARSSEICNLTAESIRLECQVPHLSIEPRHDPEDPREIKTESSVRQIPLVGVSLAAMKLFPRGFNSYKDRDASFSGLVNKYLRNNNLLESPRHSAYSLRHAFEDRMKDGGLDDELRRMLMGHAIDRPKYGSGGSLEWKRDELLKIALPYEPSILPRVRK